ncbi:TaqI-like C-terminal specificity domain-containing protein [Lactobacillus sp. AN1001]
MAEISKNMKLIFKSISIAYLINVHNGYIKNDGTIVSPINIKEYPAIKSWLDSGSWNTKELGNFERLSKRADQGITPYNLRSLAYMDDFSKQKIIWSDIATEPRFALLGENLLISNTAYMITKCHPNVIFILNSKIMEWYFSKICSDLGSGTRYFKQFVEMLQLPDLQQHEHFYENLSSNNVEMMLSDLYNFSKKERNILDLDTI